MDMFDMGCDHQSLVEGLSRVKCPVLVGHYIIFITFSDTYTCIYVA